MLCITFGRPPSELGSLPSSDITFLQALYNIMPWGPDRDNIHAGMVASAALNPHLGKNSTPLTPADFMLVDPVAREEQDLQQQEREQKEFISRLEAISVKADDGLSKTGGEPGGSESEVPPEAGAV